MLLAYSSTRDGKKTNNGYGMADMENGNVYQMHQYMPKNKNEVKYKLFPNPLTEVEVNEKVNEKNKGN
jgi:hypothetical protein